MIYAGTLSEENRRKIAGWTIMLICVGAFSLTFAASNLWLPRFADLVCCQIIILKFKLFIVKLLFLSLSFLLTWDGREIVQAELCCGLWFIR